MIDWGCPDWHGLTGYPYFEGSRAQPSWAWEFLRRNHDYRHFYIQKMEPILDPEDEIGLICEGDLFDEMRDRFGISYPFAPWSIQPVFLESGVRSIETKADAAPRTILLTNQDVFCGYDMNLPLEPQFKRARSYVRRLRESRIADGIIEPKNPRFRPESYVLYLRILDADDAGSTSKEIGDVLFSNPPNFHPDHERAAKLRDCRKAAQRLRDVGYRSLAALCEE